jgi:uncharacterized Zn-finger protein|tara:strand:+ start:101 stop:304 length:204 start_codon:yes stop_codon:yes gene_type:complete
MVINIPDNLKDLERVEVRTTKIACQADHPRVYYTLSKEGYVVCGYCSKMFVATDQTNFDSEELYVQD